MRLCRFNTDRFGCVEGEHVLDVTEALKVLPTATWPLQPGDLLVANLDRVIAEIERTKATAKRHLLSEVQLLSPIANPTKIIAAPGNYKAHVELDTRDPEVDAGMHRAQMTESDVPPTEKFGLFLKANTSLVGASEGVTMPKVDRRVDHEVELVVVIGKQGKHISASNALNYVAGYSIGLDMSFRGVEDRSFRKSADSFTVIGPYLVTADEVPNPSSLDISLRVNEDLRQSSNTSLLMVGIARMIELASSIYTLFPGDVILTGTPEGVGPVRAGDKLIAQCEQLGTLRFSVTSS